MKKKYILLGVVVLLIGFASVWWNSETVFLKSIPSDSISVIQVRNGRTGNRFTISSQQDVSYVVETMQGCSFHKSGISLFRMGTWLTLSFIDADGNTVEELIVDENDVIRDDPFFYAIDHGDMEDITDYVTNLEMQSE